MHGGPVHNEVYLAIAQIRSDSLVGYDALKYLMLFHDNGGYMPNKRALICI